MKAQVVSCIIYDSVIDYSHGAGYSINRLIVPGADYLTITPHKGHIYVWVGKKPKGATYVAEVEVSDEFITSAKTFLKVKDDLARQMIDSDPALMDYFKSQFDGEK